MTHTLHLGDCREILQTLPEQFVHCCVTSPTTGQVALACARNYIGCELNPDFHALGQQRLDGAQLGLSLEPAA